MLNNQLRIGDTVGDTKRMVIAHHQTVQRVPTQTFATWVALCVKEGEYHPYVVWNVIARPEGFIAEHGDYFFDIESAVKCYMSRASLNAATA